MKRGFSQIVLRDSVRKRLESVRLSIPGTDKKESFSDVISRLLDTTQHVSTPKKEPKSGDSTSRPSHPGHATPTPARKKKELATMDLEEAVDYVKLQREKKPAD
jgi:hypothetical protein